MRTTWSASGRSCRTSRECSLSTAACTSAPTCAPSTWRAAPCALWPAPRRPADATRLPSRAPRSSCSAQSISSRCRALRASRPPLHSRRPPRCRASRSTGSATPYTFSRRSVRFFFFLLSSSDASAFSRRARVLTQVRSTAARSSSGAARCSWAICSRRGGTSLRRSTCTRSKASRVAASSRPQSSSRWCPPYACGALAFSYTLASSWFCFWFLQAFFSPDTLLFIQALCTGGNNIVQLEQIIAEGNGAFFSELLWI